MQEKPKKCPICFLRKYFAGVPIGSSPFAVISRRQALKELRLILAHVGVEGADRYRTHDLRRGHARDLQEDGESESSIRAFGEWGSENGHLPYVDEVIAEARRVMSAKDSGADDSESDVEDDLCDQ